jgi:hypothetical protein
VRCVWKVGLVLPILQVYMTPLKESGIITPDQQKTLFANVDEIENINRHQVLASLENKFKQAHSQGIPVHKIQLGEIFQELVKNFVLPFSLTFLRSPNI